MPPHSNFPQFDFTNPLTWSQVIWMFLIFGALYVALKSWGLPLIGSVIEERERRINADLDTARLAKEEADRAVAEVTARSRAANAEAQGEIAAAVAKAKAEAAEAAKADTEALDRQLAEAEQRIHAARQSAMAALRDVATDTATAVVLRLTGHEPDRARLETAVADTMAARS